MRNCAKPSCRPPVPSVSHLHLPYDSNEPCDPPVFLRRPPHPPAAACGVRLRSAQVTRDGHRRDKLTQSFISLSLMYFLSPTLINVHLHKLSISTMTIPIQMTHHFYFSYFRFPFSLHSTPLPSLCAPSLTLPSTPFFTHTFFLLVFLTRHLFSPAHKSRGGKGVWRKKKA